MMILPKSVSKCNRIPVKIPTEFFFIGAEWVGWDQLIEKKHPKQGWEWREGCWLIPNRY